MKHTPAYIKTNVKKWKLTPEEAQEYEAIETMQMGKISIKEENRLKKLLHDGARETMRMKRLNVNFRLQSDVLDTLKVKAAQKGLPYQTLISLILHEYAKGKIAIAV